MKPIVTTLNLLELHHIKNLLETEGIRCWIRNELLSRLAGEVPFLDCAAELHLADEADRWRANALLDGWRQAQPESGPPWRCQGCGEAVEAQFTACWNCGATRP